MAGKGDKPRPINKKIFDQNFDEIKKKESINEEFITVKIGGKVVQRKIYK